MFYMYTDRVKLRILEYYKMATSQVKQESSFQY